jgi:REP element-mobilizing transposase RayT
LKRGVFFTDEYREYEKFLHREAKRINCEITNLELDDDNIDYEKMQW